MLISLLELESEISTISLDEIISLRNFSRQDLLPGL
jgi:hypothetical protein